MLKRFFASLVLAFLTGWANAALPLFQGQIVKDQASFVRTLEEEGVLKEGRVFTHVVGMKVYPWLKEKSLLKEEVTENELINQLVADYGKIMPLDSFLSIAKEGKFALADKLLKTSTPVAATTAPQATAPAEPVATTPAVTLAEVVAAAKKAAKDGLQGFDKALQVNNNKAEKNAEEVAKLQKQLAATKAAQEAAAAAQMSAAAAREELATKVAAFPALAEAAAEAATAPVKADVARLGGEVSTFKVDVNGRVSAVEQGWFVKYQLPIAAGAAGAIALLALLSFANWRRTGKVKAVAAPQTDAIATKVASTVSSSANDMFKRAA